MFFQVDLLLRCGYYGSGEAVQAERTVCYYVGDFFNLGKDYYS